jgi:O-antigen/teichoic acid export membrane protein
MDKHSEISANCNPALRRAEQGQPKAAVTGWPVRIVRADRAFRLVLSNAFLNLLGNLAPLLAAAFAVPVLVHRLGQGGFGLFSLLWVLLGYFSIFDLGLSRALTRLIAEFLVSDRETEIPDLVTTVMWLLSVLGACGGLLCALGAWIRVGLVGLPAGIAATDGPWILAILILGVPATLIVTGIRGILEGYQDFKRANALRIPAGVALMGLPGLFAMFVPTIMSALAGLFVARLLVLAMHLIVARMHLSDLRGHVVLAKTGMLFRFGGWLTVSNVVGPLIVYVDRFVLAASVSPAAVGFYAAPFEIVSRLLVLPQALANALFPALTTVHASDPGRFRKLFVDAALVCLAVVIPVALVGALLASWLLATWLDQAFARESSAVMRILLIGFVFNALAQLPLTALHSQGRARPVALLHVAELPVYLIGLTILVRAYGLTGAAWAWTARSAFDCVCLFGLVRGAMRGRSRISMVDALVDGSEDR